MFAAATLILAQKTGGRATRLSKSPEGLVLLRLGAWVLLVKNSAALELVWLSAGVANLSSLYVLLRFYGIGAGSLPVTFCRVLHTKYRLSAP